LHINNLFTRKQYL